MLFLRKQTYDCWEEGIVREFGMVMYILMYLKWITNKDLLYSTGNSTQYSVITYREKNLKKRRSVNLYN